MIEFLGETYYVDFTELEDNINIPKTEKEVNQEETEVDVELQGDDTQHISILK